MRIEKKATLVSTSTAALLVVLKMIFGILSGSVAVLASAIDSFLDLAVSAFNYYTLNQSERAPDETFNFGRGKLEAIAAVVEGTIISISGLFIFHNAMMKFFAPRPIDYMEATQTVMLVSLLITGALVLFLQHVAKKSKNLVIRADALHYRTDLYTSGAILLSLVVISQTGQELIDPILGLTIAGYMIYSAFPIIKEGVMMLLDVSLSDDEVRRIRAMLELHDGINGFHHVQTRRAGPDIFISMHLVFDESVSLLEAHRVSDRIEELLCALFPDERVHPFIHMDPYDDSGINLIDQQQRFQNK